MPEFDAEHYIEAAAAAAGLTLPPESRAGVVEQMKRIHGFARLVTDFELGPHDESAPRFEP